jgi:hypothetical protein
MKYVRKFLVPSSVSKFHYVVSLTSSGEWQCSCPRWKFSRERCKHIDFIAEGLHRKPDVIAQLYEMEATFTEREIEPMRVMGIDVRKGK